MKKKDSQEENKCVYTDNQNVEDNMNDSQQGGVQEDVVGMPDENARIAELEEKLAEANDKYLRLCAEFDNYRKRTLKERMDMMKNANEDTIKGLLPILDDFDRSVEAMEQTNDSDAVREGVMLIQAKLLSYLSRQGLSEIEAKGLALDTDLHDAVTQTPTSDKKLKGKIVDVVQKGYKLNDKVIRHSKVVMGE